MNASRFDKDIYIGILLNSKESIRDRREQFICHTLPMNTHGQQLRTMIMERLDGNYTLEEWLMDKHGIVGPRAKYRATRLRWIDSMIREFQK